MLQLLLRVVFVLIVIGVGSLEPVYALTASVDVSAGYSDNVLASSDKESSGYSQYRIDVDQTLSENDNRSFGLYVAGRYRDYFRFTNQWQATFGASSWNRLLDGQLHSYNFIEVSVFRDDLIPEDDNNIVSVGSQWRWFIDDQMSAAVKADYQFSDYRNKVVDRQQLFLNGSGSGKKNKGSSGGDAGAGTGVDADIEQRTDHLWRVVLNGKYLFNADLSSELAVIVSHNDSSLDSEAYDAIGVKNSWNYYLLKDVSLVLAGSHLWRDYDAFSEREFILNSELTWHCSESYVVYLCCDKRWNDSPINHDSYSELMSECGLIWSF